MARLSSIEENYAYTPQRTDGAKASLQMAAVAAPSRSPVIVPRYAFPDMRSSLRVPRFSMRIVWKMLSAAHCALTRDR